MKFSPAPQQWFSLPLFIALRYLRSKHSLNFISVISTISTVGITLGVAALIIVMSLFNGFQSLVERFLLGFDPHIRISSLYNADSTNISTSKTPWIETDSALFERISTALQPFLFNTSERFSSRHNQHSERVRIAPVITGKMVCINARSMQVFHLVGMDADDAREVSGIASTLVVGEFTPASDNPALIHLVMGASLADKLRIVSGDTVQVLSPYTLENAITQGSLPRPTRAVVVGIFQSNTKEYDATQAYTSLASARRLLRVPDGRAQFLDIRLPSYRASVNAAEHLQTVVPSHLLVQTWFDLHRDLYGVMRFERLAAFCVLLLIVLVAVFNIFASLSMTIAEKRAEIGMLKAMGAQAQVITMIFLLHSALIGSIGTILGVLLGVGLCLGQIHFGWIALDTTRYVIPTLPFIIDWRDVVLISCIALLLSLLAGYMPARRAGEVRSALALLRKERV